MEGSVGASGSVLTNQNNSNPRTEDCEVESRVQQPNSSADLNKTAEPGAPSSASLAQPTSAQHLIQDNTPTADTNPAVSNKNREISMNDDSSSCLEQAGHDSTDIQGVDIHAPESKSAVEGSSEQVNVADSPPEQADTNLHKSENEVTAAADAPSSSASGSDTSQSQTGSSSQTQDSTASESVSSAGRVSDSTESKSTTSAERASESTSESTESKSTTSAERASESTSESTESKSTTSVERASESTSEATSAADRVSEDHSSKLYPSLSSTSGQDDSSSSAQPSSSQTSTSQSAAATASSSSVLSEDGASGGKGNGQGESVYYIKWITFDSNKVPIITQNENGPCPLLAIMNVLLLKGKVRLAPMLEMVTSEQLMAYLGDCVFESMPQNLSETTRANYEQNMQDAMAVMHKLQTGLDVNVKFTGVADFEYTPECIIFDLLEIGLYHGWLVDPQDSQSVSAVGKCSYNQLVEKIIQQKASDRDELIREALVAEQFLDRTASQLTYHGLCELSSTLKEHELSIFFRNNHFSTLYRHNNELFVLVTDQGFLTESNVVWETLSNVDGDCHFVDANFCTYTKPEPSTEPIANSPYASGDKQIDSDYQVALSLQQDQQLIAEQEAAWGQFHPEMAAAHQGDHELALRLQEEEDRRAAAALQEQRNQQGQGQNGAQGPAAAGAGDRRQREREREGRDDRKEKKEGKDCAIL